MISAAGKRLALALGGMLPLLLSPADLLAALSYDLSLGASVMHTDNLHLDAEPRDEGQPEPVQETIYAAVPGAQLDWREGGDHLLANYRGEYWTFTGDEDRDPEWIHRLSSELEWRRWEPYFLEAGVAYERVPRYEGDQNEAILDQLDRTLFSLRTGFSWSLGATRTLEVDYRGEFESFSGGGEAEDDRIVRHYAEGLMRRLWGPLWESEVSARYGRVTQDLTEDSSELHLAAALSYRVSERLDARARVEWVREDPDGSESDSGDGGSASDTQTTFLTSAEIRRELERGGFWSLSYEERLQDMSDGDTLAVGRAAAGCTLRARLGSEVGAGFWYEDREYRLSGRDETAWGPTATARWVIAPWAALDLAGSWEETTTREPGEEEVEDRTARIGAAVVALFGRHLVAEAGYAYRENDSTNDEDSYTANFFYAGLNYYVGVIPPGDLPASTIAGFIYSNAGVPAAR